jgi:AhpD family alkylhydroperoxidase
MSGEVKQFISDFGKSVEQMKAQTPDLVGGFGGLFAKVMKAGALEIKHKELLALAVGMAVRCKPCIIMHTHKALQAGASRQEVLEAAGVVVMMQGGPAYVHIPEVIKILDELEAK